MANVDSNNEESNGEHLKTRRQAAQAAVSRDQCRCSDLVSLTQEVLALLQPTISAEQCCCNELLSVSGQTISLLESQRSLRANTYQCPIRSCSKTFASKKLLHKHCRRGSNTAHQSLQKFMNETFCRLCSQELYTKPKLVDHEKKVHKEIYGSRSEKFAAVGARVKTTKKAQVSSFVSSRYSNIRRQSLHAPQATAAQNTIQGDQYAFGQSERNKGAPLPTAITPDTATYGLRLGKGAACSEHAINAGSTASVSKPGVLQHNASRTTTPAPRPAMQHEDLDTLSAQYKQPAAVDTASITQAEQQVDCQAHTTCFNEQDNLYGLNLQAHTTCSDEYDVLYGLGPSQCASNLHSSETQDFWDRCFNNDSRMAGEGGNI